MYNEIRGINVKQVIWKIILGWKWLLVAAVAVAVVLTGTKYMMDSKNYENSQNATSNLNSAQIKSLNNILAQYDRLNYFEKYYEDSLLVKIDAKQYDLLEIQYYVNSDYTMNFNEDIEKDYTSALVAAYSGYVMNTEYAQGLIDELKLNVSTQSVRELIQVTIDKEGSMFKVSVSLPNEFDAEKLENAMDKVLLSKVEDFEYIGEHSLDKVNSSVNKTFSEVLEKKIFELRNNTSSVRNSIEVAKGSLSDDQKLYLYNNLPYDEYRNEFISAKATEPSVNTKFVVVGFVLGAFMVCAIYLVKEVFSNKLQNEDDVYSLYGINKLGVCKDIDSDKKKFFVDRLLLSIKNKKYRNCSNDDINKYVASKIEAACKLKNVNDIAFVVMDVKNISAVEEVCSVLKTKNINCGMVMNILKDAGEFNKAIEKNNVVIVSEIDKTYYSVIEENITVLRQYEANILGNVVVE